IKRYVECIHPDDVETARATVLRAREYGDLFDFELRVVHAGTNVRWLRMKGQSEMHNGVVSMMNGIAQDITDAKSAQEVIHATEVRTQHIVEAASEAFVSMDL